MPTRSEATKPADIEKLLIATVCELQKSSGREGVMVSGDTRPVQDMPGFDSLNGVETTVEISHILDIELNSNNVFVEDGKAITIAEAAKRIYASLPQKSHA